VRRALLAVLALAACQKPAPEPLKPVAATPAAAPKTCTDEGYRQLDFWVGDWIAEWGEGKDAGTGRNSITRDEFGACAIVEHFSADDGTLKGTSISTYRPPTRRWRQTWVDDQGGYFNLAGGPVTGQPHSFELVNERPVPAAPPLRMIWQDIKPDSFTWRWQTQRAGSDSWVDQWVIRYRRAPQGG